MLEVLLYLLDRRQVTPNTFGNIRPIPWTVDRGLTKGVALLGVKVTGIEPPRLTFVTIYRQPIRLSYSQR